MVLALVLITVVPVASVVKLVRLVVPPTTPLKVVVAPELIVKVCAPFTVEAKVTLPVLPLPVFTTTAPVKLVGELNATVLLAVVILLAVWMLVLPVKLTLPVALIGAALVRFKVPPVAFKLTTPLPVVLIGASTVILALVRLTPVMLVVVTAPLRVVLPVPVVWVKPDALTVEVALTLAALLMVMLPRAAPLPTVLPKVMLPPVAFRPRAWVPFKVFAKLMLPPVKVLSEVKLTASPKL